MAVTLPEPGRRHDMACIGCVIGAAGFATMWTAGKLVEWTSNRRRTAAIEQVLQDDNEKSDAPERTDPRQKAVRSAVPDAAPAYTVRFAPELAHRECPE